MLSRYGVPVCEAKKHMQKDFVLWRFRRRSDRTYLARMMISHACRDFFGCRVTDIYSVFGRSDYRVIGCACEREE